MPKKLLESRRVLPPRRAPSWHSPWVRSMARERTQLRRGRGELYLLTLLGLGGHLTGLEQLGDCLQVGHARTNAAVGWDGESKGDAVGGGSQREVAAVLLTVAAGPKQKVVDAPDGGLVSGGPCMGGRACATAAEGTPQQRRASHSRASHSRASHSRAS
jgi:hypothetical protein